LEGWDGRKRSGRNTWRRRTKKSSGGKHGEQGGKKAKKAKKAEKTGKKSRSSPTVVCGRGEVMALWVGEEFCQGK
jgi:hypothetical protein